jgi:hypothetical protein
MSPSFYQPLGLSGAEAYLSRLRIARLTRMLHTSSGISSCVYTRVHVMSYHHSRPLNQLRYCWYPLTPPRLRLCQYVQPPYHNADPEQQNPAGATHRSLRILIEPQQ